MYFFLTIKCFLLTETHVNDTHPRDPCTLAEVALGSWPLVIRWHHWPPWRHLTDFCGPWRTQTYTKNYYFNDRLKSGALIFFFFPAKHLVAVKCHWPPGPRSPHPRKVTSTFSLSSFTFNIPNVVKCTLFQMRVLFAWVWLADIRGGDGCWLSLELNNRNLINKEEWEGIPEGKYHIIWECKCTHPGNEGCVCFSLLKV